MPFIFITAFPEESARRRALHDGAVCFLSKPFDAPTLIQVRRGSTGGTQCNRP